MRTITIFITKRIQADIPGSGYSPHHFRDAGDTIAHIALGGGLRNKNIKLSVVDHDHSSYSRQLISKITSSGYFKLDEYTDSYNQALKRIEH